MKKILILAFLLLLISSLTSLSMAQEDEAKYEFNGKVGRLSSFDEDYQSTVMIELNISYSLSKHLAIAGGAIFTNFHGPSEILLGGEALIEYLESFGTYRVDIIRMDEQAFIAKIIFKAGGKKINPFASVGLGGYQFRYRQNIFAINPYTEEEFNIPIYFQDTALGINAGVGLDYYLNDFLSIKFEGAYHKIYYELIEQQMTIGIGFGFMF